MFQQTYLGFVFASTIRFLGPFSHFTAPILPLQPPRCAAVRVRFQLLLMSPADPPKTSRHCSVGSWKRTRGPARSYARSSRVCGHYAQHFLCFSEINVLSLNISTTFVKFFFYCHLVGLYAQITNIGKRHRQASKIIE